MCVWEMVPTTPDLSLRCSECWRDRQRVWSAECHTTVPHQDWPLHTPSGMADWEWGNGNMTNEI